MRFSNELVANHLQAGRFFEAGGINGFVVDKGSGPAVLCMHGVPSSSFLYRHLLTELAAKEYRGLAFDLPGMGLSDKPTDFDYNWTGLGKWCVVATEALELDHFHLVIHDIGGPIGLEMVAAQPERILSLTILNTLVVDVAQFTKPWSMRPFEWPIIGELYLMGLTPFTCLQLMQLQGIDKKAVFQYKEAEAYVQLLKSKDNGKAFLKIMRSFETTMEKEQLYKRTVKQLNVPKQIIWGANDPALSLQKFAYPTRDKMEINRFCTVPGKHFLQEDYASEIVEKFVEMNKE